MRHEIAMDTEEMRARMHNLVDEAFDKGHVTGGGVDIVRDPDGILSHALFLKWWQRIGEDVR